MLINTPQHTGQPHHKESSRANHPQCQAWGWREPCSESGSFSDCAHPSFPSKRVTSLGSSSNQTEDNVPPPTVKGLLLRGEGKTQGTPGAAPSSSSTGRQVSRTEPASVFLPHELLLAWPCAGNHDTGIGQDFPLNQGLETVECSKTVFQSQPISKHTLRNACPGHRPSVPAVTRSPGGRCGCGAVTTWQVPPRKPLALGLLWPVQRWGGACINRVTYFLYSLML